MSAMKNFDLLFGRKLVSLDLNPLRKLSSQIKFDKAHLISLGLATVMGLGALVIMSTAGGTDPNPVLPPDPFPVSTPSPQPESVHSLPIPGHLTLAETNPPLAELGDGQPEDTWEAEDSVETPEPQSIGRSGHAPDEGEIWGETLPGMFIHPEAGGGTDMNPNTYLASDYEQALLARAISAEAFEFSLEHHIAVGEVIMRRVMSSEWYPGAQDTIHDVLSAEGQYPMTWRKITNQINHNNPSTEKATQAAAAVLAGMSDYSQGSYFQHSNQGRDVFFIDDQAFSQTRWTRDYALQSFLDADGHNPELYNPTSFATQTTTRKIFQRTDEHTLEQ